ncbi:hypothetical protein GCM10023100_05860 [Actinocorallia cavernae]|uniref:Uncharacterized protein n=2 Tax=Actinomycetes TaxID=1760 RepID=A0ABP5YUE6_9ACTN
MKDGEGGDAGGADQVQELEPRPDVKAVGELVQHEELRALGQCPCRQDTLAFVPGQGGIATVREGPYTAPLMMGAL